jgi:hypothetical protein
VDGGAERKSAAPAIVELPTAAKGAVARGVRWSPWPSPRWSCWLRGSSADPCVPAGWLPANGSVSPGKDGEARRRKKKVAQDEEYLARLSSTVEKPEIEPPVKRRG